MAAVSSSVPTEDTYLVEATGQAVLDLRDSVEKMLNDKDSAGELARFTSLWVIPRLVEEVRVGMRLQVIGSDSKQFEGRSSRLIADLPLRTATTTARGLSDLDLTKPGSYVFATEKDAQACKVVNAACFEALANAKFLDREQTITMPTLTGDVTKKGTYRDILADMMGYSIEQTYNDIKSKTVLGVSLDKYDKMTWNMDWTPVLDKYGFADRAAVVEDFQLAYTVSMVDRIGTVTLFDGYAFLNSGRVGNGKVFDSESLKRGEVLVELPITQFKESRSALQDLYLKDFSPKTRLLEKSDEHKKLLAKAEKGELTLDDERRLVDLNYEYSRNAEESAEKILSEQREEFGRRNMINTGKLDDMIKVLKGN